jgi:hypothetical protein
MANPYNPLAKWEDGGVDGSIRISQVGQPSVFDMIKVLGGQKNPKQAWLRLKESHPEVVPKCDYLLFPGPGQRETPVAKDKEAAYYILGLLPGAVGKKYREDAAKVFVQALDDPAGLVERLAPRLTDEESKWLEARLSGKRDRNNFTSTLRRAGVATQNGYRDCTNAIYLPVLGHNASQLKGIIRKAKGITTKNIVLRDHFEIDQLDNIRQVEVVSAGQLRRLHHRLQGKPGSAVREDNVKHIVRTTAQYTQKLRLGEIAIPGLE